MAGLYSTESPKILCPKPNNFFVRVHYLPIFFLYSLQSRLSTCICLCSCNDNFPINPGLSKGGATSWLLKSTLAPLPPDLMNIYSGKMAGIRAEKIGLNIAAQDCLGQSGKSNDLEGHVRSF